MTAKARALSASPVLVCGCLLLVMSFGYRSGFGLFMQPMTEAYGYGRDVFSLALATQNLAWGVMAIFAGGLADRYGLLTAMLLGVGCYVAGMVGMAYASTETGLIATAGILIGTGISGTSFGIVLPAIARAVAPEQRGQALGIATAAGSFGQFLVVPIMQEFIGFSGWFMTLHYFGISALVMALLALPLAPYGGSSDTSVQEINAPLRTIVTRALHVRSYVLLLLGFFVCGFHVAFIIVHMPSYLVDLGFDARVGAWSISIIGLCNVIGSVCSGIASNRYPMRKVLIFIYGGRVVAICAFLLLPATLTTVFLFSAVMGFLWLATIPPTTGLVATFFGTKYMTLLYSVVFLSHQLGSFSGIWLGGWLYEQFGNYTGIWIAGIILGLITVALHAPIQERNQIAALQT